MVSKLKLKDSQFDLEDLEGADPGEEREDYEGEIPPRNKILTARVEKIWANESGAGNFMLVCLLLAQDNTGDLAQYNGLPVITRVTFTTKAAFMYKPFLTATGIKLSDLKDRIKVEDEDASMGTPVISIAKFKPGENALIRFKTDRTRQSPDDEWRCEVKKWMPAEVADEPAGDDDGDEF